MRNFTNQVQYLSILVNILQIWYPIYSSKLFVASEKQSLQLLSQVDP